MAIYIRAVIVVTFAVGIYLLRQYMMGGVCKTEATIHGKVVIVTGANVGLGKSTAQDMVSRGGRVILACRSIQRGETAMEEIIKVTGVERSQMEVMELDLSSLDSIRKFVTEFKKKEKRLDILINNAGVMWVPFSKTADGFELTFGVNHLGHFLLTNLLIDMLKQSAPSRIVTVSSMAYNWGTMDFDNLMGDNNYQSSSAYSMSKLANILFSRELAHRLEGTRVTTYSVHPGMVRTELGRHIQITKYRPVRFIMDIVLWPFLKDSHLGAQTQICCAVDPELETSTGKFYSDCAETQESEEARNDQIARRLWDVSAKLVKLNPEESA